MEVSSAPARRWTVEMGGGEFWRVEPGKTPGNSPVTTSKIPSPQRQGQLTRPGIVVEDLSQRTQTTR